MANENYYYYYLQIKGLQDLNILMLKMLVQVRQHTHTLTNIRNRAYIHTNRNTHTPAHKHENACARISPYKYLHSRSPTGIHAKMCTPTETQKETLMRANADRCGNMSRILIHKKINRIYYAEQNRPSQVSTEKKTSSTIEAHRKVLKFHSSFQR